jgi:hypothetical protein
MESDQHIVHPDELLARFILYHRYFRKDNTVRADAFIPHPYTDLSVTRHLELNEKQLRDIGISIAAPSEKVLQGRADILAKIVTDLSLSIKSAPLPDNPNHANIAGWPPEKSEQKSIAQQIAASKILTVRY